MRRNGVSRSRQEQDDNSDDERGLDLVLQLGALDNSEDKNSVEG